MNKIQVVLLAGGQGSRLRPYTTVLPKPLMPVGEVPIAEIIIRQLRFFGFQNIVISTGHLAELIEAYFRNGHSWGVSIQYIREDKPLGTAGAIKFIRNLADHFLVINGDILTDLNFQKFFTYHKHKKGIASIALSRRNITTDFGVVLTDQGEMLADYIEKPTHQMHVSMGINFLHKRCREYIREGEYLGMPDLFLRMKKSQEKIYCYRSNSLWLDLGRLEDLEAAQDVFVQNKKRFLKGR